VSNLIRDETGEEPSGSSTGWWHKRGVSELIFLEKDYFFFGFSGMDTSTPPTIEPQLS
jgi:hypothetical protein